MKLERKLSEASQWIKARTEVVPQCLIILGQGLEYARSMIEIERRFSFFDIPYFVDTTVEEKVGFVLFGTISGFPVVVLDGRFHLYEGFSPLEVAVPVQLMHKLGATVLITTNAAGKLNPDFNPGDIMLNIDHLNLTGQSPLVGEESIHLGSRYIGLDHPYDIDLQELTRAAARHISLDLKEGVYAQIVGPEKETPAELRMICGFGADAVGMSSVMETIAAVHCGMKVIGLSRITDDTGHRIEDTENMMSKLIEKVVEKLCVKAISNP